MANKLRQLRVVPIPQREHVAGATEDDGFPPPVVEGFLGEDEMPRCDVVPGPGEAGRDRQLVLVFADRGLWLDRLCRTLGTKPRPLPYSLPSGSFLARAAKSSLAAS
jgi:hypothetical protein